MRDQSVLEVLEEDRLFMFRRLTERDDADLTWSFRMHNRNRQRLEKAQRDKSLLRIVEAVIFVGVRRTFEDFRSIDKVEAVQLKIGFVLGFTPRESHANSVYTLRLYVKESLAEA